MVLVEQASGLFGACIDEAASGEHGTERAGMKSGRNACEPGPILVKLGCRPDGTATAVTHSDRDKPIQVREIGVRIISLVAFEQHACLRPNHVGQIVMYRVGEYRLVFVVEPFRPHLLVPVGCCGRTDAPIFVNDGGNEFQQHVTLLCRFHSLQLLPRLAHLPLCEAHRRLLRFGQKIDFLAARSPVCHSRLRSSRRARSMRFSLRLGAFPIGVW